MSSNQSSPHQQPQEGNISSNLLIASADGQVRCILCFKKNSITSCKQCSRCTQISCKSCFKVDSKVNNIQILQYQDSLLKLYNKYSECHNKLEETFQFKQYRKVLFQRSCLSIESLERYRIYIMIFQSFMQFIDSIYDQFELKYFILIQLIFRQDNYYEYCVELSNTKYKEHLEMKLIEKEIFEDDIYSKKNMNRSFAEFLNTIQNEISQDKVKQDQYILLRAFISFMLEQRQTPEDKIYLRGHGMIALFLLCFCSIKKAFYILKEIYFFMFVDILHPDHIKKEANYCSIVKHIVFIYLENFQKKKEPSAQFIEKIVAFTRKYLYFQYNFFFLNQLNFSCAFQILELLFTERSHEVLTRAMASIINLNIKFISEGDVEKLNLKDIIYNKVQPEVLQPLLAQSWVTMRRDAVYQIIQDHKKHCELEKYRLYDIGADQLDKAVKTCIKKQKDNYKIMENHYLKEVKDLKNALKLAMNELESKAEQIQRIEVEKNNILVKLQALKKKYEVTEIEYEDIQQKLQFLNERAGKRQMHYNKEYEQQVSNLQHQVKNQKLDYRELDMLYRNQSASFKQQMEDKDNIIKRLKQGIHLLQRQRNEINVKDKVQEEQLQEVYEFCKNNEEKNNQSNDNEDTEISKKLFRSYFQPSTNKNLQAPQKKFDKNSPQLKQTISEKSEQSIQSKQSISQSYKQDDEQAIDEIEDEQRFYAVNDDFAQRSQTKEIMESSPQHEKNNTENEIDLSSNDQLSQSVLQMYKSCSYNDPLVLQQAINMQNQSSSQTQENNQVESEKLFISNLENPNFESNNQNKINNLMNQIKQPFYCSSANQSPQQNQLIQQNKYHSPQLHPQSYNNQPQSSQFRQHQVLAHSQSLTKSASPYHHPQSTSYQENSQKVIQSSDALHLSPNNTINNQQTNTPPQKINNLFGNNFISRSTNQRSMTQLETNQNSSSNNYDIIVNGGSFEKQQQNHRRHQSNQVQIQNNNQQN